MATLPAIGIRTSDDGKTWTAPKPTSLVHPDARPCSSTSPTARP